jgi:signal peptidase I
MRSIRPFDLTTRSTWMLLAAFAVLAAGYNYSFRLVRVQGPSMEPTFHNGECLLMRRANWPILPLHVGDVVVFRLGPDTLIKRVAALPGDLAPIEDYGPIKGGDRTRWCTLPGEVFPSAVLRPVPRGSLYVLGDNADNSEDSRYFGPVPAAAVIGKVVHWATPGPPDDAKRIYATIVPRRSLAVASLPVVRALASPRRQR